MAAPADRTDLLDHVRPGHQPHAPLKKAVGKVRAQAVADHRNLQIIDNMHKKRNLVLGAKLRLIHNNAGVLPDFVIAHPHQILHKAALFL